MSKKLKAQAADSLSAPSKKFRGKRLYPHWPLCKRVFSDIKSFAQIIIRFLEKMKLKLLFRTLPGKFPGAAAHILYRVRCRPAKNCFRFLRIRPKSGKVSIPAWANHIGQLHLVCCLKCMNQFQNRDTVSRAKIDCLCTSMVCSIFQRFQIRSITSALALGRSSTMTTS